MADWNNLQQLYTDQNLSSIKIAKIKGCSCDTVLRHLRLLGIPIKSRKFYRRELANNYKGGRYHIHTGYVTVLANDHPFADKTHRVYEHRLVMEAKLGRYLLPTEVVHHRNGIRDDNRPENLEVVSQRENVVLQRICRSCPLRKEIRLLQWQIKQLRESIQLKLTDNI